MGVNLAQAGPGTKATPITQPQPFGQVYTYYANSPAGVWTPDTTAFPGATSSDSGTALRKFVDSLPGLGPQGANNLGNYIPVANKATNPIPGDPADYYQIELVDYNQQMHSDLPGPSNGGGAGTKLRGYRDLTPAGNSSPARYLGPLIIAKTFDPTKPANVNGNGAPVRIKYKNSLGLGAAGKLFIPVDTTAMGAGEGPLSNTWDAVNKVLVPTGNTEKYPENRTLFHLHGGVTPWISDGTPHQWFTPAGETTSYKRGVSQRNVPDMADPGDGYGTYYYSNEQSGRLMFYHDHAYGLTRLNVYAGEAAGYLLYDQTEQDLISGTNVSGNNPSAAKVLPDNGGGLNTFGIPLIIQDKTFVPKDVAVQDAKWDRTKFPQWGTYGDLWFPHVYEPNQNPLDPSGANPYGRWDYGPWFWPPVVVAPYYAALPSAGTNGDPSLTPEAFMDTPIVNGAAYPYLNVEPKAYRFRILNAANDRPFNLQTYVSDPASPGNYIQGGYPTEVAMVPASAYAACTATSLPATTAVPSTCTCTATYAPFGCFPATWPSDGRPGGVPDPQFSGPKIIQIGTEGGFLPAPVVLDNQPVGYEYNRRNIVVLDVLNKTLFLAPAERADIILDFSAYAGKTVILYNDAPAPNPAFDTRYDYFTNDPDQTFQGGAPSTLPGFGPNTRTIMQFRVAASTATPFTVNLPTLTSAIQTAFTATQPPVIVPEPEYAANYAGDPSPNLATPIYSTIYDNSLTFTPLGGGASQTVNFISKAIQELWDPWGRMNATLGVELPMTNITIQTTIPLGFADPNTERVDDGVVQIWKITHNGVDTHPVHFHLFDVQLINRVGWDGAIRPPDPNEIGWKETVKMKPLEDVIVALRPALPKLPFGIPTSTRALDPTLPLGAQNNGLAGFFDGSGATFMGIDPLTGNPITVTNVLTDFGHEYVWHCHILGHEENDFMRSLIVNDVSSIPPTPTTVSAALPATGTSVGAINLSWTDASRPGVLATYGNPANEIGFRIYRCSSATSSTCTPAAPVYYTTLANATSFVDQNIAPSLRYRYMVSAFNAAGESAYSSITSSILTSATLPPYISITAPASATQFALGSPVNITANASAPVGQTLTRVDFYAGATLIGTSSTAPYTISWTPAAIGTYSLTAQAVASLTTTSAAVSISVVTATTAITSPAAGATYALGAAIPVTASATAIAGRVISLVEFYDGATLIGTSYSAPFGISWTTAAAGAHSLTSKVFYSNGATVVSAAVAVNVVSTSITVPVNGAAFNLGSPIAITATAATAGALTVTKIDFFADGAPIGSVASPGPYSVTWNGATGGVHSLTATATYSDASTATSPAVSVVVLSATITAPAAGSSSILGAAVPITASVLTGGSVTVNKVDFYAGATLIGTSTTAPYTYSWIPASAGAYSLTATATFSNAMTATSPAVAVTVGASVIINPPVSGATFAFGAPINITATATPPATPAGTTTILVEFFADGGATPIGVSYAAPFSYSWTTAAAGSHTLTAQAFYSNGTSSTSAAVPVGVLPVAPTPIGPSGTVATATPTYTWNAVTNATDYTLYMNNAGAVTQISSTATAAGCGAGTGICSVTPAITLPSGAYIQWIVKASNSAGAGPWSTLNGFTYTTAVIPVAPTPIGPSGTIATATPTYTWNAVTNATDYTLYMNNAGSVTQISSTATAAGCGAGTGICSVTPAITLPSGAYIQWIVKASNSAGAGPWSTLNGFTYTTAVIPVAPTPVSPLTVATTNPTYTWNAVSNATNYTLYMNKAGAVTQINYTATAVGCGGGTGTCSVAPGTPLLAVNDVIYWIVNASNAAGASPWSALSSFLVQ